MNEVRNNRLLIIDDDEDIIDLITTVAEPMGYAVSSLTSGKGLGGLLSEFDPTAIILDLRLPDTDGVEIMRQLCDLRSSAAISVMSGMDARVLHTAEQLGAMHGLNVGPTLPKPFGVSEIEALLSQFIGTPMAISEDQIRDSIRAKELVLHYQPKVLLSEPAAAGSLAIPREGRTWPISGFEALVRWQHPQHGLLPPGFFIPLAEKSGLIVELTESVLDIATRQIQTWSNGWRDPGKVAINVPAPMLTDAGLPTSLAARASDAGFDASRFVLEMTETSAMADTKRTMEIATKARIIGFQLSLDDFGTGYSSLSELYKLPFSEMKIDRSFVKDLGKNKQAAAIVRSIINLAHDLEMTVCAEGVENEAALQFLIEHGCDEAQGFFFSRPIPPDEVQAL